MEEKIQAKGCPWLSCWVRGDTACELPGPVLSVLALGAAQEGAARRQRGGNAEAGFRHSQDLLLLSFGCTRTTSTDDPTASRTRQRLRVELDGIFNLLILVIWTRRYFITEFLISEKIHEYHRENILEFNVSYIYVN